MEYIDRNTGIRNQKDILQQNKVLTTLNEYGEDTSLYDIALAKQLTENDLYVLTRDGRVYNGTIKCDRTKQKDRLKNCKFALNVLELDNGSCVFQIMLQFPDSTWIDARGYYARTHLHIVRKGR